MRQGEADGGRKQATWHPDGCEVRTLFSHPGLWLNPVAELANLTAAITGMRMGEIQALRHCDVRLDGLLVVEHSWSEEYGLKETKTYCSREIPIPDKFARRLYAQNGQDDEFVFSIGDSHKPLRRSCILDNLRSALERMGYLKQCRIPEAYASIAGGTTSTPG